MISIRSWLLAFLVCIGISTSSMGIAQSESGAERSSEVARIDARSEVSVEFPAGLTIASTLSWDEPVEDAWIELLYSVAGNETLVLVFASAPGLDEAITVDATAWVGLQAQFVPPGVTIAYHWRLVDASGVLAESAPETTRWLDDRQEWLHLESDQVSMHYFGLGEEFALSVLEAAQQTITDMERRFDLDRTEPVEIWAYPTRAAFVAALPPNTRESVAGASFPDFSIILGAIPDGNVREAGRVILHEIAHLVLFQATANPFTYPPLWFNEGLATQIQIGGTERYMDMVINASEQERLFSLESLNVSFPFTAREATLAYAASWSALEYIALTWGDDGIARLIDAYATGVPWDDAMVSALGLTTEDFERGWHDWIAAESLDIAA